MKAGQVIAGRYRIESRLGVGGMGEVWRAIHTGTGRDFAIKFMHAHAAANENARQRFSREARASAKINHPNIIDVFDVGEMDDGVLYLVMELLDGVALGDAFHADPAISVQDLFSVLLDTSQALAAAHAVGIIHRDIKPANIFLHKDRATGLAFAKVLDFGISKFTGDDVATRTGSILGSPRYMSPEQTRSAAAADARADIWALGVMMFEGLTGTWPHEGDSFSALVVNICTVPPKSIDELAPRLPDHLRAVVRRCLAPYDERVQSANELSTLLEDVLRDESLASIAVPRPQTTPGEGFKSTTGLRVRPPSVSSLSASRNQARAAAAQQQMSPLSNPRPSSEPRAPLPPPSHPTSQPRVPPPAPSQPRASVPMPPPQPRPPSASALPLIADDTTTRNGGGAMAAHGGAAAAIEPATLAYDPATLAYDPSTVAQAGPARPISGSFAPMQHPGPMQPPAGGARPPSHMTPGGQPYMSSAPTAVLHQHPLAQHGRPPPATTPMQAIPPRDGGAAGIDPRPASHPRAGDPLVQSVSAMNVETTSPRSAAPGAEVMAPMGPPSAMPAQSPFAPARSTKKLGILAALLAAAFVAIVIALVATIRGGSGEAAAAAASGAPSAPIANAAAPPPGADAPAAADPPKATASAAASAAPSAAPASTGDKDRGDKDKGDKPKSESKAHKGDAPKAKAKATPPASPPATTTKAPKRVQDLGSGL